MVCRDCRPSGAAAPAASCVELLASLLTGDWGLALASSDRDRRTASGLVAAYVNWHLERGLKSLPLVDRTPGTAVAP